MTLIWFVVWVIADRLGDRAPLHTDPVNIWTGALILAVALDLSRQHASGMARSRGRSED
ncbi:MAG TPA: hypothetical protein VMU66_01345 [Gaiellales bacterium]|nr:hypothetical protein [Gaiellales bacterium]